MNLATGSLMFIGMILLVLGAVSKFMGLSLLEPLITSHISYFIAANSCLLLALVVDKFQKS